MRIRLSFVPALLFAALAMFVLSGCATVVPKKAPGRAYTTKEVYLSCHWGTMFKLDGSPIATCEVDFDGKPVAAHWTVLFTDTDKPRAEWTGDHLDITFPSGSWVVEAEVAIGGRSIPARIILVRDETYGYVPYEFSEKGFKDMNFWNPETEKHVREYNARVHGAKPPESKKARLDPSAPIA